MAWLGGRTASLTETFYPSHDHVANNQFEKHDAITGIRSLYLLLPSEETNQGPAAVTEMTQPSNSLNLKRKLGQIFDVEKSVAVKINFVKGMLEDVDEKDGMQIPMGEVETSIFAKVLEFCKFRYLQELNQTSDDEVDPWEKAFVQAANFLDVQSLLDLTCKTVADMIKGKTPEQIRAEFDIDNDFTPEQQGEVRRANAWCAEER